MKPEKKTQSENHVAQKVLAEKKSYEGATQKWRLDIQEIWKAMNGELSQNVYPWENPQFIPKMRTEISFVIPFIFSGDPNLEVTMIGDEDKDLSFILDKMLSYRIENNPRFYNTAKAWVTQGVGLGTSMIKISWLFRREGNVIIDRPVYSVPNILDIFQNPMVSETQDQASIIERVPMTVADIKKDEKFNDNKKTIKPIKKTNDSVYGSDTMSSVDLDDVNSVDDEMQFIDLHERWSKETIQTIAESATGPVILREQPNPYGFIPYVKFIYEDEVIPNRCNGKGVGQNTLGLQEMYYDLFNLIMLNLKIVVNKMWRIDPGSRVNPSDLIARPGGTIRATKEEAEWVEQSDLKQSGFQMLDLISREHQRASGATDIIQGSPSGARTLGQDQLSQGSASNRFELVRRRLKSALAELGMMTLKMEMKNLQSVDQEIMKIFPQGQRQIVFDILMAEKDNLVFDVVVKGDTVIAPNKDIMAKQLLDLFNLMSPKMNPQEFRHFGQEIARLRGVNNIKDLIPDFQQQQNQNPDGSMVTPDQMAQMNEQNGQAPTARGASAPADGNAMPRMNQTPTSVGINQATYGQQQPRI